MVASPNCTFKVLFSFFKYIAYFCHPLLTFQTQSSQTAQRLKVVFSHSKIMHEIGNAQRASHSLLFKSPGNLNKS